MNLRVADQSPLRWSANFRAVQILLGQTKIDSAVRYLGLEPEDALVIAEAIEIQIRRAAFTGGPQPTTFPSENQSRKELT